MQGECRTPALHLGPLHVLPILSPVQQEQELSSACCASGSSSCCLSCLVQNQGTVVRPWVCMCQSRQCTPCIPGFSAGCASSHFGNICYLLHSVEEIQHARATRKTSFTGTRVNKDGTTCITRHSKEARLTSSMLPMRVCVSGRQNR